MPPTFQVHTLGAPSQPWARAALKGKIESILAGAQAQGQSRAMFGTDLSLAALSPWPTCPQLRTEVFTEMWLVEGVPLQPCPHPPQPLDPPTYAHSPALEADLRGPVPSHAVFLGLQTNQASQSPPAKDPAMKPAGDQRGKHTCTCPLSPPQASVLLRLLEALEVRAEATPHGAGERFWLNWCGVGGREMGPLKCNISELGG